MLSPLVQEARALIETAPTGAAAQNNIPRAIRWLMIQLRKDNAAKERVIDGVESAMEDVVDRLRAPAAQAPIKKGRGKKAAEPPPPQSSASTINVSTMTPQELLTRTIDFLDSGKGSVVETALDRLDYDEAMESWLVDVLNDELAGSTIGPWHCIPYSDAGKLKLDLRFAGDEQEEDTNHPGPTDEGHIAQIFKHTLGASYANFNWSLDDTPRDWSFQVSPRFVLNYRGLVEFIYKDGQAALAAVGNKVLLQRAAEVLARAREE